MINRLIATLLFTGAEKDGGMPTMDFLLTSDDGQWEVLTVMLHPTTSPHDVKECSSALFSKYAVLSGLFGGERQWQDPAPA